MDKASAQGTVITIGMVSAGLAVVRDLHFHKDRRPAIESAAGAFVVTFVALVGAEFDPMLGVALAALLAINVGISLTSAGSTSNNPDNVFSVLGKGLFPSTTAQTAPGAPGHGWARPS